MLFKYFLVSTWEKILMRTIMDISISAVYKMNMPSENFSKHNEYAVR